MQQGKFDEASVVWFTPEKKKPPDPTKLQAGMFMDRADLWKPIKRKHRKKVAQAQLPLFGEQDGL